MFRMNMDGTKWTIFHNAVDLFAERGYANVSIRDIANVAKIRPSSIYYHFQSKNEILESIIEYCDHYYNLFLPPLESILSHVGTETPGEVLHRIVFRFNPEMQDIMTKTFLIVTIEAFNNNPQAKAVIDKNIYNTPKRYMQAILTEMMEQDKIDEVDINAFTLAFTSLCHSTALRIHSNFPVTWEELMQSVDLLFGILAR